MSPSYVAGGSGMDDETEREGRGGDLGHVLQVGEDGVFQAVPGVGSATALSGAQVFSEPGMRREGG